MTLLSTATTTRTGTGDSGPKDPQTQSIWLPGLGLYYSATEWLGVLASANEGFSPIPPGSSKDTEHETAWNYEAGVRIQTESSTAEVVGFLSKYKNLAAVATISSGSPTELLDQQLDVILVARDEPLFGDTVRELEKF